MFSQLVAIANPDELEVLARLIERLEKGSVVSDQLSVEANEGPTKTDGPSTDNGQLADHPAGRFVGKVAKTKIELGEIMKEVVGVGSEREVHTWLSKGMPGERGHYDVNKAVEWYLANNPKAVAKNSAESQGIEQWNEVLKKAVAQREALKTERLAGRLYPRSAVEVHYATLLTDIGDLCEQLPDKLRSQVPKSHAESLRQYVMEALNQWRVMVCEHQRRVPQLFDESQKKAAAS